MKLYKAQMGPPQVNHNSWRHLTPAVTVGTNISPNNFSQTQLSRSSLCSVINNPFYHTLVANSDYESGNFTKNKKCGVMYSLLQRCVSKASCSSFKSKHVDSFTSVNVDDVDEDKLPGVRVQRDETSNERLNTQISEQDVSQWLEKETGLDRIRMMYSIGQDGLFIQESTRNLNTMFYRTVIIGSVVSFFMAASRLDKEKTEKYISKTQAIVKGISGERKAMNKLFAEGAKTTLRLTVFSALLYHLSQIIAAYRNESSVWEYVISSSLAFGTLGIGRGLKQYAKQSLSGAVIGMLAGYVVCRTLASNGLNQEQRHLENVRKYLQNKKLWIDREELA